MSQECINPPADTDIEENPFEEPEDACLRRELDLRPIAYDGDADNRKDTHPDQRPCPSWCWVGRHPEYGHEIDPSQPMVASHTMEPHPSVVASLYPGEWRRGARESWVSTATLEPRLDQIGQAAPQVRVAFRRCDEDGRQVFDHDYLRLTITDARELVTALRYLIEAAERG